MRNSLTKVTQPTWLVFHLAPDRLQFKCHSLQICPTWARQPATCTCAARNSLGWLTRQRGLSPATALKPELTAWKQPRR